MKNVFCRRLLNLLTIVFSVVYSLPSFAQAPHKMTFQAVIRNAGNDLVTNSAVSMRISILHGSSTGTAVYVETQHPTTNGNGLVSFYIGTGTVVSGAFDSIDWAVGPFYIKSETDPSGGSSYTVSATQQLVSVPYAFYAEKSGVPGAIDLPEIATGPVSGVTYTTATSVDTLKANGGEFVFARGVCVDTLQLPNISTSYTSNGNSIGAYTVNLTNLVPGKHYYLRAFATNSNGTAYGDTTSFNTIALTAPTVTSDTISNVGNTSASGGGNVTADGGSPVTARGICYGTSASPTIANSTSPSGSGLGIFSTTLSGLTPATTYYGRAYATNAVGTSYGVQRTFTTILYTAPVVTTDSATNVACTSVIGGLNTSSTGNSAITQQGICYSTSVNPTTANTKMIAPSNGVGHQTFNITGLTPGVTYHVRAYSTNSIGTSYGVDLSFTTLPNAVPTITSNPVIGISTTGATSGGDITVDGCSNITVRGVCWGRSSTPTKDSAHTTDGTGTGTYNSNISGLSPATTYYVRAYATNATGTGYGPTLSFTTQSVLSTVTSVPVVGTKNPVITTSTVTSGGYVSLEGGSSIITRGVCYGTSSPPTVSSSIVADTQTGLGYLNPILLSLTGCGTTFYVRAYATNTTGTGYGNQYSVFSGFLPTIVDSPVTNITATTAMCGGFITDGGCSITKKGLCWDVNPNPDTANNLGKTNNGAGAGAFTATMTGIYPTLTYHVRAYAVNARGITYGADQTFTALTTSSHYLGESYAGGIIFYLDSTGNHGLVCASTDQSTSAPWGCSGTLLGNSATSVGSGASNTATILANCTTTTIAAKLCDDLVFGGYNDWFLPSKDELNLMYTNLKRLNIGVFAANLYWSSSENGTNAAWVQDFVNGTQNGSPGGSSNGSKSQGRYVRAVRVF